MRIRGCLVEVRRNVPARFYSGVLNTQYGESNICFDELSYCTYLVRYSVRPDWWIYGILALLRQQQRCRRVSCDKIFDLTADGFSFYIIFLYCLECSLSPPCFGNVRSGPSPSGWPVLITMPTLAKFPLFWRRLAVMLYCFPPVASNTPLRPSVCYVLVEALLINLVKVS